MGGSLAKIQKFIYGWAERNGYTNRRVTHTPTDPGAELEGGIIMTDFLQRFRDDTQARGIPLGFIFNMDETGVVAADKSKTTYAKRGSKKVSAQMF
jgi:hypothetical protein